MHHLIAWCGFFGAWMLVAGPLSQASRELEEEEIEREDLARAAKQAGRPEPVSAWWWLLPPVHYLLKRRSSEEYRDRVLTAMPAEKAAAFVSYRDKADTWAIVGTGAFFIAVKETWELREAYEWPEIVFWLLIVVMIGVAVAATVARRKRRRLFA